MVKVLFLFYFSGEGKPFSERWWNEYEDDDDENLNGERKRKSNSQDKFTKSSQAQTEFLLRGPAPLYYLSYPFPFFLAPKHCWLRRLEKEKENRHEEIELRFASKREKAGKTEADWRRWRHLRISDGRIQN